MKRMILIFIGIFFIFLFYNLIVSPLVMDEVWAYGFTNNIYRGMIPYRDFNMIIPPFFVFLMSLPFHLFGSSMLVFHVENAILITILFILLYQMLGKKTFLLFPLFIFPLNVTFPNYNFLLLFLFVLILFLEKKEMPDFWIGFVLGLLILTKQTVGFCMIFPFLFFIKNKRKILHRVCGCFVPCCCFLIYLLITNTFSTFLDLGVFGLFDFGSSNQGSFSFYFFLTVLLLVIEVILLIRGKNKLFLFYLMVFVSITFPIFDYYHVWLYFIAFFIVLLTMFDPFGKRFLLFQVFFFFFFVVFSFLQSDIQLSNYPNDISHFEYRYLSKKTIVNIQKYNKMIQENNNHFVVIGPEGYLHKISLDLDATYLEMLCSGNFGYHGYDKMMNLILERDSDTLFFLRKQEINQSNSQIDKRLISYIQENGVLQGEDELYYFYLLN